MDIRSFQLNYELTAFIYDEATTRSLADQYRTDLEQARELSPKWPRSLSYPRRVLYAFAGLLSPLL